MAEATRSSETQGLYLGLMSGTSADAVDVAVIGASPGHVALRHAVGYPLEEDLRSRLLEAASRPQATSVKQLAALDHEMGVVFSEAALAAIQEAGFQPDDINAIGSHGQTVYHLPEPPHPTSLQIGDPNLIAARTGITTVSDFRRRDMALGGQGAPLAPAFHRAVFLSSEENRCVVNIGGIANITLLGSRGEIAGFDTGPGNSLMDAWALENLGRPFDADGAWAASACVDETLLQWLLDEPYFSRPLPKSTGRDYFNPQWLHRKLERFGDRPSAAVVQRTLCALTAHTITTEIRTHTSSYTNTLVCGGGAHNPLLRRDLQALLAPWPVATTAPYGVPPDWVEACAFGWLAMRTLAALPGNEPAVTGAARAAVLGAIYPGTTA